MTKELQKALDNVEMTYSQISEIADNLIKDYTSDISKIIDYASNNIDHLTNDDLRSLMLRLSIKAFTFGEIKEKSAIKARCAEMLKDEAHAKSFNGAEGSINLRENISILNTGNEIVTETIYDLIANLFKIKLDEIRRMVDTLKTVLMSRLAEAKLSSTINEGMEE